MGSQSANECFPNPGRKLDGVSHRPRRSQPSRHMKIFAFPWDQTDKIEYRRKAVSNIILYNHFIVKQLTHPAAKFPVGCRVKGDELTSNHKEESNTVLRATNGKLSSSSSMSKVV